MHLAATKRKRTGSPDNSIQTENVVTPSTSAECFPKVFHDERFGDVTFLVGPSKVEIKAQKIFLKAKSAMLRENFSEKWGDRDTIELSQFDPMAVRSFLKVMMS